MTVRCVMILSACWIAAACALPSPSDLFGVTRNPDGGLTLRDRDDRDSRATPAPTPTADATPTAEPASTPGNTPRPDDKATPGSGTGTVGAIVKL